MWGALPGGPLHLQLCSFAWDVRVGWLDVGGQGIGDLRGGSAVVVLSVGGLSSGGVGAACNFGGLLVVGHSISPLWFGFLSLCFHPWGVSWVFLG